MKRFFVSIILLLLVVGCNNSNNSQQVKPTMLDEPVMVQEQEDDKSSSVDEQEPLVFIYHTHNHESFIPEAQVKEPDSAFHDSKNITLVGERLSHELKEKGINNIHDNRDIMGITKERGLSFAQSYMVSKESLQDALQKNKSIKMAFDIHRDSMEGNDTTQKIYKSKMTIQHV